MKYTVIFKHTCPTTTWAQDLAARGRPPLRADTDDQPIYGREAGKGIDDRIFMAIVEAAQPLEAADRVRADALPGWGTIVYLVFEGDLRAVQAMRDYEQVDSMELA